MKKEIKRLQKAGIDGTYFQDSWVVAKDNSGNMLLDTDVLISEEKVENLARWIDEFIDESDEDENNDEDQNMNHTQQCAQQ